MSKFEKILQDYMTYNDKNGISFYSISYLNDSINQKKSSQEYISKELIFKQLENHTYNLADIYNLLSEGKITAAEIVKHTSIDAYDMLMDELKDFDKKNKKSNHKAISTNTFSDKKEGIANESKSGEKSEETILELSKKVMDFLTDAKEILVIKK